MRGGIRASVFVCAGTALWSACIAEAATKGKPQISAETLKHAIESKTGSVQLVTFPDTGWGAVKIVRGGSPARDRSGRKPATEKIETAEIVTFADSRRSAVRILRGDSEHALIMPSPVRPAPMTMQVVTFANLRDRAVSILRGPGFQVAAETELFGPASAADLDRVAFAVDGAEFEPWGRSAHVAPGAGRAAGTDAGHCGGGVRCRRRRPVLPRAKPCAGPRLSRPDVSALRQLARRDRGLQLGTRQPRCLDRRRTGGRQAPCWLSSATETTCCARRCSPSPALRRRAAGRSAPPRPPDRRTDRRCRRRSP